MSEAKNRTVILPVVAGEDRVVECCLNGVNYRIARGEKVSVPVAVYEILRHSHVWGEKK